MTVNSQNILDALIEADVQWKYKGQYVTPTIELVNYMVGQMAVSLRDLADNAQIESGGILMRKDTGRVDTFVFTGSLDTPPPT